MNHECISNYLSGGKWDFLGDLSLILADIMLAGIMVLFSGLLSAVQKQNGCMSHLGIMNTFMLALSAVILLK